VLVGMSCAYTGTTSRAERSENADRRARIVLIITIQMEDWTPSRPLRQKAEQLTLYQRCNEIARGFPWCICGKTINSLVIYAGTLQTVKVVVLNANYYSATVGCLGQGL